MRIEINKIPFEGLTLEEEISPALLDLETDIIKFRGPLKAMADAAKITNAVTVNLALQASMNAVCSRCLDEFTVDFKKSLRLSYHIDKSQPAIDLNPDIREEVMLDYPIKPLCRPDCKGLCPKCGKNLNQGWCNCIKGGYSATT